MSHGDIKMKNKQVRKMLVDIKLKGRKLFWFGEESEVFLANSKQQLIDEFGEIAGEAIDEYCERIPNVYNYMWRDWYCGETERKEKVYNWIYGDENEVSMISTSYN